MDHAAMVAFAVVTASMVGGVSSAMASVCMWRCWSCHSSLASSSTTPISLMIAPSLGKTGHPQ